MRSRIDQVWFAGSHSDVGGGGAEASPADLGYWWLAGRVADAGLTLDPAPGRRDPTWSTRPLHDSRTGFFRLLPARTRRIGVVDPETESLASTVLDRRRADDDYDPSNVTTYLGRDGVVTTL